MANENGATDFHGALVGPLGFEPRTKGFSRPPRFRDAWTMSSPAALKAGRVAGVVAVIKKAELLR